jgi:hypothetical protein
MMASGGIFINAPAMDMLDYTLAVRKVAGFKTPSTTTMKGAQNQGFAYTETW